MICRYISKIACNFLLFLLILAHTSVATQKSTVIYSNTVIQQLMNKVITQSEQFREKVLNALNTIQKTDSGNRLLNNLSDKQFQIIEIKIGSSNTALGKEDVQLQLNISRNDMAAHVGNDTYTVVTMSNKQVRLVEQSRSFYVS